jgi:hypothetical protein
MDLEAKTIKERSVAAPTLALPKGGGAIRGICGKLGANTVTGRGSMSVPIVTSPGHSGFGPQFSLQYVSASSNRPFGFEWSLSISAITGKTDKGLPQYLDTDESDILILSGSEDLVPVLNPDASQLLDTTISRDYKIHYVRPRTRGLFIRTGRRTHNTKGEICWRSIAKNKFRFRRATGEIVDKKTFLRDLRNPANLHASLEQEDISVQIYEGVAVVRLLAHTEWKRKAKSFKDGYRKYSRF